MAKLKDLTGQEFGRLTVIKRGTNDKESRAMWLCKCECGNEKIIRGKDLRKGNTRSCGCLGLERRIASRRSHGFTETRLYSIWCDIKKRCYNPNSSSFVNYGGRGIEMCNEWLNNFSAFRTWSLEHGYEENLTIDRIDNDRNYSPNNCRWVTRKIQNKNTRRNIYVVIEGEELTLSELAEKHNVNYGAVKARYHRGIKGIGLIEGLRKLN